MLKRSTAALLLIFLCTLFAAQFATVTAASATNSNFYWKASYGRGVGANPGGATAACATGAERGAVLTAPFAVHGSKPGLYLCYPVCKAGYKGTGPICWQNPAPAGYVDCGAGVAVSETLCGSIVANQLISISAFTLAAVSLGTEESAAGEDFADLVTTTKTEIKLAAKSPKVLVESEKLAKELLPVAKAAATSIKSDLKAVADGVEDAPAFAKKTKTALTTGGLTSAKIQSLVTTLKKAIIASKVTLRVGSILYNAVHNQNTSPVDYMRDATAISSFAFGVYEISHPEDKVPGSTIMGTMAAFMYPQWGVTY